MCVCLFVFAIRSYLAQKQQEQQQQGEDKAEEEEEATKFINK